MTDKNGTTLQIGDIVALPATGDSSLYRIEDFDGPASFRAFAGNEAPFVAKAADCIWFGRSAKDAKDCLCRFFHLRSLYGKAETAAKFETDPDLRELWEESFIHAAVDILSLVGKSDLELALAELARETLLDLRRKN